MPGREKRGGWLNEARTTPPSRFLVVVETRALVAGCDARDCTSNALIPCVCVACSSNISQTYHLSRHAIDECLACFGRS